jgi:hypothetical protein
MMMKWGNIISIIWRSPLIIFFFFSFDILFLYYQTEISLKKVKNESNSVYLSFSLPLMHIYFKSQLFFFYSTETAKEWQGWISRVLSVKIILNTLRNDLFRKAEKED